MLLELEKRIRSKESSGLRSQHFFAAAASACFKNVRCCPHDTNQRKSISDLQHLDTYSNSMKFSNLLEPNWHRRCHNPAGFKGNLTGQGGPSTTCPLSLIHFYVHFRKLCPSFSKHPTKCNIQHSLTLFQAAFSSSDAMR